MQHASLRAIYNGGLKPKAIATVSPVLNDEEDPVDEGNNFAASSLPFRNGDSDVAPVALQTKSSLRPASSSSFFSLGRHGSNQEDLEGSAEKYAVVGQKHHWRRTRSQHHGGPGTIKHVAEADVDGNGEEQEELGERASSYLSRPLEDGHEIPTLAAERFSSEPSQNSSRESSRHDTSRFSSSRRSQDDGSQSEREMFVVTRQKKSKYAAKLHMPGQNPLYLGRYRSEEAARAACESAFMTITTPRK